MRFVDSTIVRRNNEAGVRVETKSDWFVDYIEGLTFILGDEKGCES